MFRGEHFDYVMEGGIDRKWPVRTSPKGLYCVYDIVACMLEKDIDRAHAFKKACADNFPAIANMELAKDQFGSSRFPAATKEQASAMIDFIRAAMTIPGVRRMQSIDDLVLPDAAPAAASNKRTDVVRVYGATGKIITYVREDGYFNAFHMVGAVSKAWTLFARDETTHTQLKACLEAKGLDWFDAVRRSEDGCVWVHPDVAVALAGWCDPDFVPRVRRFVDAAMDFDAALTVSEGESRLWGAIKDCDAPPKPRDLDARRRLNDKHLALAAAALEASKKCAECWADSRAAEARAIAADKAALAANQAALQAQFDLAIASRG